MTPQNQDRKRRLAIALPIVALWLVAMGWLLYREWPGPRLEGTALPAAELPPEAFFAIELADGRRVGHLHLRQGAEERGGAPGFTVSLDAQAVLELLGETTELALSGSTWRPDDGSRAEFDFEVESAGHRFGLEGQVAEGQLDAQIVSAGETIPLEMPIDDQLLVAGGLGSSLSFPALEVGDRVRFASFDPLTLRAGEVRVRCVALEELEVAGEIVEARVLMVDAGGFESRAWVDAEGQVLRAETPLGLVLQKTSAAEIGAEPAEGLGGDFLELTAVRPRGERPFRGAEEIRLRLGGVGGLEPPEGPGQEKLSDGTYRLSRPAESAEGGAAGDLDPVFLKGDAFIQAEHPKIRAQALEIVEGIDDPWRRAVAIYDWVYTRLDKEPVPSLPSALEVLETRRGDCNEHAVLFAALARASGLPTRVAVGLVWSDDYDGFYYHAWPEVHVGRWIAMDPTLGQPLADATHLELLEGGVERWPRLLPYLGRLEIEILEVR